MTNNNQKLRRLQHGMLLDAKSVMDNALPDLAPLRDLIPDKLYSELECVLRRFEDTLCEADVSRHYTEG